MLTTPQVPLTDFPSVGEVRAKKLEKLGLYTAGDLLRYFPRDYEDRRKVWAIREAPLGEKVCVRVIAAESPHYARIRAGLDLIKVRMVDETAAVYLTFFNQTYVRRAIQAGEEYVLFGVIEEQGNRRTMTNPVFERADRPHVTERILPIYRLTAGLSNRYMVSLTQQALACAADVPEDLPASVRQQYQLAGMEYSLRTIHTPASFEDLERARRRLSFEELFYLAIGLEFLKQRRAAKQGVAVPARPLSAFLDLLPFSPTSAQKRVMEETAADLASGRPMNRLVQGDVGSGKTVVAAWAAFLTIRAGHQAALMAPTEVLAEQHFRSLSALLSPAGIRVGLLTGALTQTEKKKTRQAIAAGEIDLIIGTHALISKGVAFSDLALMIADEQHRFGVAQRAALVGKAERGYTPHVLVMSATPIPRTLALIVYGDLDVSVIDQLPPGRTPVETYVIHEDKRVRMQKFVRRLVEEGRQVYLICPAVEEETGETGESLGLKAVKSYARQMQQEVFPDLNVGLVHGKMRPKEKDAAMTAFAAGEIQILVATTVVEVGVDVPNAALIVIENAERFGLSQLHQLRGRVGRGNWQSYCILVTNTRQEETLHRLRTLASMTDGFRIAEEDLKQRGPGDFFGNRQHGMPQTRLASELGDLRLLQQAQQAARELLTGDPRLDQPENAPVQARVQALFADTPDIFN